MRMDSANYGLMAV